MSIKSFDPWLQKENAVFSYFSDDEISDVLEKVYVAWKEWRSTSPALKAELLDRLGNLLMSESREHGRTITSEMGKVIRQSVAEVEKCASLCFWYSSNVDRLSAPEKRQSSAGVSHIHYEPQGIILGIMPWNFPYWQAMRFIVPVLAGGNAVILRHASSVPLCALKIEKLFTDAGFPENLCRTVFADYAQVERIISRSEVRGVSLTGSTEAGRRIAGSAGKNLKKSVMELGGNDPFIVLHDADLEAAADAAIYARFQNCGQSCIAAKRLLVQSSVYDRFMKLFIDRVNNMKIGDPYDNETFIGPMINEGSLLLLHDQVTRSVNAGAKLIAGGERYSVDKPVYKPTVLSVTDQNSPVVREEVFGPVIPVILFTDADEAVMAANSTEYGLGASVWSGNHGLASDLASRLDTGTVAINGFVRSDPALPFGGVKDSGYGRELSAEGFREFLNIKSVTLFG